MFRVVLDPNVLVSAAIAPDGIPGQVVRAAFGCRITVVVCPLLLAELRTVLRRPAFRRYLTAEEAEEFVRALTGIADEEPDPPVVPVTRDPGDDYLVALAVRTGADRLVSGDADVLDLADPPCAISSPRSFLSRLEAAK